MTTSRRPLCHLERNPKAGTTPPSPSGNPSAGAAISRRSVIAATGWKTACVRTVAWEDGDPDWVFPAGTLTSALQEDLQRASDQVLVVAASLDDGYAGWNGSGLEYHIYPCGKGCLSAIAENDQVSFIAQLLAPGVDAFHPEPPTWTVDAEICVRCDHPQDCGTHTIEERAWADHTAPSAAVSALAEAVAWLAERSSTVLPQDWRARDQRNSDR